MLASSTMTPVLAVGVPEHESLVAVEPHGSLGRKTPAKYAEAFENNSEDQAAV